MESTSVIAIYDIGETGKKIFLLDERYSIRWEKCVKSDEVLDEDDLPYEDTHALTYWVKDTFGQMMAMVVFEIRVFNFSVYGANFIHLNDQKKNCRIRTSQDREVSINL